MSFKPIDPKRDEIRRYLERGSVLDSLTKIFIRVIKERPENPMEYIRNNIGVVRHQHDKYERLTQDLQEANEEIQRLRGIINSLNPEVLREQQGAQGPAGETDSEPVTVTVAVQVETAAEAEQPQASNQNTPVANSGEKAAVAKVDAEVTAALDNCHIEETNMAAETTINNTNQISSVQTEPSRVDNTE